jgi:hypothetical protein
MRLLAQDSVDTAGCGGNCQERIITKLWLNFDADCDGTMDTLPGGTLQNLCVGWEWRKPGTGTPNWSGNIQAFVSIGGAGERTVNLDMNGGPTPVRTSSFRVYAAGGATVVEWQTASEAKTAGFNLYRYEPAAGAWARVNEKLLVALPAAPGGSTFRQVDPDAAVGSVQTYALGEVNLQGIEEMVGPFRGTVVARDDASAPTAPYTRTIQGRPVMADRAASAEAKRSRLFRAHGPVTGDAIRITTTGDGLHFVDAGQIAASLRNPSNVPSLIKSGYLQLTNRGRSVAYTPAPDGGGIYFNALPAEGNYTDENVYWLKPARGTLMTSVNGRQPAAATGGTFLSTVHVEQDNWPQTGLFDDPAADFWSWDFLIAGYDGYNLKSYSVTADGLATGATGTAELSVRLRGGADAPTSDPDHHLTVAVNGTRVGEITWDGTDEAVASFAFDAALLRDGENLVELGALLDPGVEYSFFQLDSFDLAYPRRYLAANGSLVLRGDGNQVVTVAGFTAPDITVLDITDPLKPKRVVNTRIEPDGAAFRVSFSPTSPTTVYLASSVALPPAAIAGTVSRRLKSRNNTADYLVIAPEPLKSAAGVLADYRHAQGLDTKVVDLASIYDEFNFGLAEPAAIKAFLAHAATEWRKAPRFVLLAGKGSYDYRDLTGAGDNLLPPMLAATPYGLFSADNRFADVSGDDGVPEMAIGRLPATTAEELLAMIDKIKAYESADGAWREKILMTADVVDPLIGDFHADSELVAGFIPPTFQTEKIYLTSGSIGEDRQRLLASLNDGAFLLNYIGHGSIDYLSGGQLLSVGDAGALVNGSKLPLVAAMTCVAGRYEIPGHTSLAESLLLDADGGAAAVWTASGLSESNEADSLDIAFMREATGSAVTVGEAVRNALVEYRKGEGSLDFMLDIYQVLGDPALRIR